MLRLTSKLWLTSVTDEAFWELPRHPACRMHGRSTGWSRPQGTNGFVLLDLCSQVDLSRLRSSVLAASLRREENRSMLTPLGLIVLIGVLIWFQRK